MSDLQKKSRWVHEAMIPAKSIMCRAGRGLSDLPTDVTPGARQVALLTGWNAALSYALAPVSTALVELSQLPNWSGGFLVANSINFDWRTAPFKQYGSFEDFFKQELETTWREWTHLSDSWIK